MLLRVWTGTILPREADKMRASRAAFLVLVLAVLGVSIAFWLKHPSPESAVVQAPTPSSLISEPSPTELSSPIPTGATAPSPPISLSPPPPAAPQVSEALHQQFLDLSQEVFKSIPTKSQLAKLPPEEVHYTPQVMFTASVELGKIAQMVSDHPGLASDGLKFYKECAENEESPTSLRASCYAEFQRLSKSSGVSSDAPQVPQSVSDLAQKVM
jgi:type IV secretory pathway VirB10-like protein